MERPLACRDCDRRLSPLDVALIISWLANGKRCRHCVASAGIPYGAVEAAAILIVVWAAAVLPGWLAPVSCVFGWALLTLAVIDRRHLILPDQITLPLIFAGLAVAYFVQPTNLADHVVGAMLGFVGFALIAQGYRMIRGREGLGLGDAKLLAAAGAWVSWSGLPSVILLAASSALLVVFIRSLVGRSVRFDDPVPFGPYLALGTWLVWLYGPVAITL